jgi:hypothetical protein
MQMLTEDRGRIRIALATALLIAAAGVWLAGAQSGSAANDTGTQGIGAEITSTIDWDPASCNAVTTSDSAQNFGAMSAGGSSSSLPFIGCVNSNSSWDVTAQMTTPPSNGSTTIPATAFEITRGSSTVPIEDALGGVTSLVAAPFLAGGSSCGSGCALNSAATIVNDAAPTTLGLPLAGVTLLGGLFTYDYTLNAPGDQEPGTYTGGVVTFTASN